MMDGKRSGNGIGRERCLWRAPVKTRVLRETWRSTRRPGRRHQQHPGLNRSEIAQQRKHSDRPRFYRCSMLCRLAMVSVEVAPAQTRTLSIFPGK